MLGKSQHSENPFCFSDAQYVTVSFSSVWLSLFFLGALCQRLLCRVSEVSMGDVRNSA